MPTIDNPEMDDSIKEEIIQAQIKEIRDRSRIPTSEWRKKAYLNSVHLRDTYLAKFPDHADGYNAPRPPEEFEQEDQLRDQNMVTSADLLDLHLSELKDFKTFKQRGVLSERTEQLVKEVTAGLIWGIETDKVGEGDKRMKAINKRLTESTTPSNILVALHELLSLIHSLPFPRVPVKDLYWQDKKVSEKFFDFLSNDLR